MTSRGHALSRDELVRTLTVYSGITTADGAFDGTATLVDSNLTNRNDFISGKTILIMSGDAKDEDKGATSFNSANGTITLQGTGFSAQIKAGTIYRILNISSVEINIARQLLTMDFWSDPQEEVVVTGGQTTPTLPTVTIADLPAGATIVRAIAMLKFRMVENTNAAENSLDHTAAQPIQVRDDTPGTWRDAINFVDEQFKIAATTREGGDVLIGSIDIAVEVDANDGYNFQWLNAKAHLGNIHLNDVQVGLRIWYSV